jgi:asparagine synthase (glutamine-hydrolysing)
VGELLLVSHRPDDPEAAARSRALRDLAGERGLGIVPLEPASWMATAGPRHPTLTRAGAWTLIGDVLDRRGPDLSGVGPHDPLAFEKKLTARFWGRFIGVRLGGARPPFAVLRDPSGGLECVVWRQDGLTLIASFAPAWLVEHLRPPWRIDRDRLARALVDPLAATGPLILDGPTALEPGTLLSLDPALPQEVLWTPATFAMPSLDARPPVETAAARLRAAVDEAVDGLARRPEPLAAEVSGGLDSSVVASSLVRDGQDRVGLWLNAFGSVPEADERRWAEVLAAHLGIAVEAVPHADAPLTGDLLESASQGLRPGLNGLDHPHDLDWATRITRAGLSAVMTGKGGDSLFQQATPEVFGDRWRARGWRALFEPDTVRLAAANDRSVWSLLRQARVATPDGAPFPPRRGLAVPQADPVPLHPWLVDLAPFGPAKRLQIAGVADGVSRHGPSLLTSAVEVLHPFCAQPVVEACLALDCGLLTLGGSDRGLVRHAFSGRLPDPIIARRSKGDMSRVYGRRVADNLSLLRPWILHGQLAEMGLIDRASAETLLSRESLMWKGRAGAILATAAIEAWVRVWRRRLGGRS